VAQDLLSASLFSRLQNRRDTDTKGERKYAANALTQIRRVQAAAAASEPVIIVEDDLLAAAPAAALAQHLCQTLRCTAYSKVSLCSALYTRYTSSCSGSLCDAEVHRILNRVSLFFFCSGLYTSWLTFENVGHSQIQKQLTAHGRHGLSGVVL
jgi:hypothetical protein